MKRGTESIVRLGKGVEPADFSGINVLSTVILGKKESATKDFNGLFITDAVLLGKKISHSAVVTATVHGVSPLSLPSAVANSISYVKAFGGTEQRNLPAEYTQVEYIESTGRQYIDTGIIATNWDWSVEFEMSVPRAGDMFFGAGRGLWGSTEWGAQFGLANSSGNANWGFGSGGMNVVISNLGVRTNTFYNYKITKEGLYINGELKSQNTATESFSNSNLSLWICKTNNPSTSGYNKAGSSWKYVRIYNADTALVFNGVPAKNSSGVVGMYDFVSGQFFTNAGTGTFAAGGEAVPTPDTPMDIVSNNGVLKASKNLFNPNATQTGWITTNNTISGAGKYIRISAQPGDNYTFSATWDSADGNNLLAISARDSSDNGLQRWVTRGGVTSATLSVTAPVNTAYLVFANYTTTPETIQLERGSTATPYHPYGQIYTDGTVETIKDSLNNIATCEDLLNVGAYADTQDILTGTITRNVKAIVLDGTEAWSTSQTYSNVYTAGIAIGKPSGGIAPICNYYAGYSSYNTMTANDYGILVASTATLAIKNKDCADITAFTTWLAEQYAAGTPVIVIYPLAEPTTESVAGQTLQVQAGDNTLEITQASLSNLELEAQYQAAVSLTIQEVQDANLDPNVEVTIN